MSSSLTNEIAVAVLVFSEIHGWLSALVLASGWGAGAVAEISSAGNNHRHSDVFSARIQVKPIRSF
jgi:hypothetical protein